MKKLMMLGRTGAAMALALIAEAGLGMDSPGRDPFDPGVSPVEDQEESDAGGIVDPPGGPYYDESSSPGDSEDIKEVFVREGLIEERVLPNGDRLLAALVVNAKAGAQYKIMGGSTQDSFPVEICRSPIVETSGALAFSGICKDSSLVFFDVLIVEDSDVEVDPNPDPQLLAPPVIAPLSDGTPAFEFVRDGDDVRVKARIPNAVPGVIYALQGSPDVAFANPVEVASGSATDAKGLELSGTVPGSSRYFFRAIVRTQK